MTLLVHSIWKYISYLWNENMWISKGNVLNIECHCLVHDKSVVEGCKLGNDHNVGLFLRAEIKQISSECITISTKSYEM